jgi:hypothetical protein
MARLTAPANMVSKYVIEPLVVALLGATRTSPFLGAVLCILITGLGRDATPSSRLSSNTNVTHRSKPSISNAVMRTNNNTSLHQVQPKEKSQ